MYKIIISSCALLLTCTFAFAQQTKITGAEDLAGAFAQHHSRSLPNTDRATLNILNRQLRDASRAYRDATTDEQKQHAAQQTQDASNALIELLDNSSLVRPLALPASPQTLVKLGPVEMSGDRGMLLFKVTHGTGKSIRALTSEFDFFDGRSTLDINGFQPDSTTYFLLTVSNIPQRSTDIRLTLRVRGKGHFIFPIKLNSPKHGRIQLSVLSDDNGKPTPAMIRMVWSKDGKDYRPRNAHDFTRQFDTQGSPTGRRNAVLKGNLQGPYYCIPGPMDMTLPPGEWTVTIRRGTEHVPITDSFTIESGQTTKRSYRPKRWVNMKKSGWWSGDDHVHFQILSDHDAEQLMTWVTAEDIHLANILKMGDISRTWFEQRGFGKDFRIQNNDRILVPGQECPRTHNELGHTISLNITDMVRDTSKYYQYNTVHEQVHDMGGLWGFAHVNSGIFHVHRGMSLEFPEDGVDFVELLQFANLGTELYYDFLNLGFKVTASAGSDVPWGGTVGEVRVYAYLGKKSFTADRWFSALENGRTFVTNGPMIDFRVNKAYPGDEINVNRGETIRITARAWGHEDFAQPTKVEIIQFGKVIAESTEVNAQGDISLNLTIDAEDGCWLAARVETAEGYKAHTTPVYVVRDDLRFWDMTQVPELLKKRRASLDEIDNIVHSANIDHAKGGTLAHPDIHELSLQGTALKTRVDKARNYYSALEKQFEAEKNKRK